MTPELQTCIDNCVRSFRGMDDIALAIIILHCFDKMPKEELGQRAIIAAPIIKALREAARQDLLAELQVPGVQ